MSNFSADNSLKTLAPDLLNFPLICKKYFLSHKLIISQSVHSKILVALNTPPTNLQSKERARGKTYEF